MMDYAATLKQVKVAIACDKQDASMVFETHELLAMESALELAMRVESGYVVVPVEPTEEMIDAAQCVEYRENIYRAMIQAATKGTRG